MLHFADVHKQAVRLVRNLVRTETTISISEVSRLVSVDTPVSAIEVSGLVSAASMVAGDTGTGQRCNGNAWLLAGRHQSGFELGRVGPVGAPRRITRNVWVFEHGVHDSLRAHDLARSERLVQGGFTAPLRWAAPRGGAGTRQWNLAMLPSGCITSTCSQMVRCPTTKSSILTFFLITSLKQSNPRVTICAANLNIPQPHCVQVRN